MNDANNQIRSNMGSMKQGTASNSDMDNIQQMAKQKTRDRDSNQAS